MNLIYLLNYTFGLSLHIAVLIWLPILPVKTALARQIKQNAIPLIWGFFINFLLGLCSLVFESFAFSDSLIFKITIIILQQISIFMIARYLYRTICSYIRKKQRFLMEFINIIVLSIAGIVAIVFLTLYSNDSQKYEQVYQIFGLISLLLTIGVYISSLGLGLFFLLSAKKVARTRIYYLVVFSYVVFLVCLVLKTVSESYFLLRFCLELGSILSFFTPGLYLLWKKTKEKDSGDVLPFHVLSPREKEIALHLAQGISNKDISQSLFISIDTVKKHASKIYYKMGIKNRTELAILYQSTIAPSATS